MSIEQNNGTEGNVLTEAALPPAEPKPQVLVKVTPKKRPKAAKPTTTVSKEDAQAAAKEAFAYLKQISDDLTPVLSALASTGQGDAYVDSLAKIKTLEENSSRVQEICAKVRQVLSARVISRAQEFG